MEFEIEVGKRYIVKPWGMMLEMEGVQENTKGMLIHKKWRQGFTAEMEEMLRHTDRAVEVISIDNSEIMVTFPINRNKYVYRDQLLGPAFEWGEMIEVRDKSDEEWKQMPFRHYRLIPKTRYIINVGGHNWEQFRPIPPLPPIRLFVGDKEVAVSVETEKAIREAVKDEKGIT